jgi:hypothetical protein
MFETGTGAPMWFLFVDLTTPLRLWTGHADYRLKAEDAEPCRPTDTSDKLYKGGVLVDGQWPLLRFPINGTSAIETFTLSGVRAEALRLVGEDADQVDGAQAYIGLVEMINGQATGPVQWVLDGIANTAESHYGEQNGANGQVIAITGITLQIVTGDVDRKHAEMGHWTGPEQRRRFADDAFCDRVALYDIGTTRKWP